MSQFTLYGDLPAAAGRASTTPCRRTRRSAPTRPPSREARALGVRVETGRFRADMKVHAVNDGPVTLWLDSVALVARGAARSG